MTRLALICALLLAVPFMAAPNIIQGPGGGHACSGSVIVVDHVTATGTSSADLVFDVSGLTLLDNDVLVVLTGWDNDRTTDVADPADWVADESDYENANDDITSSIHHKVITDAAGEASSYTFTVTSAVDNSAGILYQLGCVDNANPIDISSPPLAGQPVLSAGDSTPTTPSVTTVTTYTTVLSMVACTRDVDGLTPPAGGWTELPTTNPYANAAGTRFVEVGGAYLEFASTGATGDASWSDASALAYANCFGWQVPMRLD